MPSSAPGSVGAGPSSRHTGRAAVLDVVSATAVWAAGAAAFFRAQVASGFDSLMGNNGDERLIAYLCEHWYQLLRGQGSWRNLAFFYPLKGLLGWSDSFVLYEIFYAPLRAVGCDPFLALQLTLVLLSAVGFASFVVLVRRVFGAPRPVALVGGLLFSFSNALWLHVSSPQLLGVYIVPLVLILGVESWRALPAHLGRSAILAALGGLLWALLFYTTYYVAWFAALAAGIAVVVAALAVRRPFVVGVVTALRRAWRSVMAAVVGFAVGIVPFAMTYLPVLHQFGGLRYGQVMGYAPVWRQVADVGAGNLVWSGVLHRLVAPRLLAPYELTYAVTPVLVALAVLGGVVSAWRLAAGVTRRPRAARSAVVLAVTALILVVLPVRTERFGSLWALVWHIPGATAIRAIDRLEVVAGLVVTLAVVAAATELSSLRILDDGEGAHRRRALLPSALVLGLLLVAVVEQFNTSNTSGINRPAQLALLRSAPPPPACRSFFVVDRAPPALPGYVYQIDAMLISQELSLPTLNGYTAHNPVGWKLKSPLKAQYRAEVAAWADAHDVRAGLCQLNLATMRWSVHPRLPGVR